MDNHFIVIAEAGDFIGEQKLIAHHLKGEMKCGQWHMEDGTVWEIIVTGVGAINVMKKLHDLPRNSQIINMGYAGSANYEIGSVVCVKEAKLNHPCVSYPEPQLLLKTMPSEWLKAPSECLVSVCYSNTDFVLQSDYKNCVFDMELAYIAAMGFENLVSLKIVSDNLSLHDYREVAAGVE
jgi:hypothetical protein